MKSYEIIIVGVGPAGLQAGIHTARRKHSVLILGKPQASALWYAHIENYFGVPGKASGAELLKIGLAQAQGFGAEFLEEDVVRIEKLEPGFLVETETGKTFRGLALILALGVKKKKKLFKDEDKFVGKGVSYCVDCDAWFYRGKRVAVIGDGSAALHGAHTLTKFAEKVYLIPLKDLSVSAEEAEKIEVIRKKPLEIVGEDEVSGLKFEDGESISVDGIFIEIGAKGPLELLAPLGVELDPQNFNYVKVNQRMETNVPGVFACGDLTGPPLQLAKAVGEGCVAGISASDYVKALKGKG
ncbi:MAG: NAD(P)/FAD-dependent oxidoreductase [Thermodesulfobacteriaceae bacterium]|jgi:thioredoxin reductase (NADPH)